MSKSTLLVQLKRPSGDWIDVGHLVNEEGDVNQFTSLPSYWETVDRPILGQIFEQKGPDWSPAARVSLPHWFSHLLPEGPLRAAISASAQTHVRREFHLLRRIGIDDLPGATRAVPLSGPHYRSGEPQFEADLEGAVETEDPILKYSLDGVQLKFSVRRGLKGLVVPARGQAGDVIVKFPDGRPGYDHIPEAEYASLKLARLAGIEASGASLVEPSEISGLERYSRGVVGRALAVSRFDRGPGNARTHVEELAQLLNISPHRYWSRYDRANFESIGNIIANLAGVETVGDVIDRIVLNVLVGNGDAHLKNWAVLYPDGHTARLAPAYDIVPTILFIANDNLGLNLNGTKDFSAVTPASFELLGERTGYGASMARRRAVEAVERILAHWSDFVGELWSEHAKQLDLRLSTLPLARG